MLGGLFLHSVREFGGGHETKPEAAKRGCAGLHDHATSLCEVIEEGKRAQKPQTNTKKNNEKHTHKNKAVFL